LVNQQKSAMQVAEFLLRQIENPFSTTHASVREDEKIRSGLQPGGIRLSLGLQD